MSSGVVLYDTAQNHKQRKAVKQYYEKKGLKERFEKELKAYRKASKHWGRVLRVKEEEVRDGAEERGLGKVEDKPHQWSSLGSWEYSSVQ